MPYEQKPNSGTLFHNQNKATERSPDMSGPLLIDPSLIPAIQRGEPLRMAAWTKQTSTGSVLLSISVSEQQAPNMGAQSKVDDRPF